MCDALLGKAAKSVAVVGGGPLSEADRKAVNDMEWVRALLLHHMSAMCSWHCQICSRSWMKHASAVAQQ